MPEAGRTRGGSRPPGNLPPAACHLRMGADVTLRVLGISASPRLEGNSDLLVRNALLGCRQVGAATEYVRLCDYRIEDCDACYACMATGECRIADDYYQLLDKVLDADRIIFATPVFFMTVPGRAKAFIDRGQCLWVRKTVLHRPLFRPGRDRRGMIIAVGGSRSRIQFDCVRRPIQSCFRYLEVDYVCSLFVNHVDAKGAVLDHPHALKRALQLGQALAGDPGPSIDQPVHVELF